MIAFLSKPYILAYLSLILVFLFYFEAFSQSGKPIAVCNCGLIFGASNDCIYTIHIEDIDSGSFATDSSQLDYEIYNEFSSTTRHDEPLIIQNDCKGSHKTRIVLIVRASSGLADTCSAIVELQDGNCFGPYSCVVDDFSELLGGSFSTPNGLPIAGVELLVDGQSEGKFNHQYCIVVHPDWNTGIVAVVLEPIKENDIRNGVNTLDLIYIRRAILQLVPLSHYSNIAADVNNDKKVSTLDMIQIRQAVLRQIDEFTSVPSWRFIQSDFTFGERTWDKEIPFYYEVDTISTELELDFIGIKMGDVNFSADATRRSAGTHFISIEDQILKQGRTYDIPFQLKRDLATEGYQLELRIDPEELELVSIEGIEKNLDYNLLEDGSVVLVSKVTDHLIQDDLFTLQVRSKKTQFLKNAISIDRQYLNSELYTKDQLEIHHLALEWTEQSKEKCELINAPNPVNSSTSIFFYSATQGEATASIFDIEGRKIFEHKLQTISGCNTLTIDFEQLGCTPGIYQYNIETAGKLETGRLLKL